MNVLRHSPLMSPEALTVACCWFSVPGVELRAPAENAGGVPPRYYHIKRAELEAGILFDFTVFLSLSFSLLLECISQAS